MSKVLKWSVDIDDKPHLIGNGPVVHVASQYENPDSVQIWTLEQAVPAPARHVQVFGTGHYIPSNALHVGSCITSGGRLVWHIFEVENVRSNNGN